MTSWSVEWDEAARKELRGLDPAVQRSILRYLRERIAVDADPRRFGRALVGNLTGLWRYRVGDHRLICKIEDKRVVVLVVKVGHRRSVHG